MLQLLIFSLLKKKKQEPSMVDRILSLEGPKELKAITVNGSVIVESEEERLRYTVQHSL